MKKYLSLIFVLIFVSVTGNATDVKFKELLTKVNSSPFPNAIPAEKKYFPFDHEKNAEGLGYSIHYRKEDSGKGCTSSFYIYDKNKFEIKINDEENSMDVVVHEDEKAPIGIENTPLETLKAYSDIFKFNPALIPSPPTKETVISYVLLFHKIKSDYKKKNKELNPPPVWVLVGNTSEETMGVGVTTYEDNFLKVRISCPAAYSKEDVTHQVEEGAKWLNNELNTLQTLKHKSY